MFFLGTPYSHPHEHVRNERERLVTEVAAEYLKNGHYVYSPITHTAPIARAGNMRKDAERWKWFNAHMLALSEGLIVLMLDGWAQSEGLCSNNGEIAIAAELRKPKWYVSYEDVMNGRLFSSYSWPTIENGDRQ